MTKPEALQFITDKINEFKKDFIENYLIQEEVTSLVESAFKTNKFEEDIKIEDNIGNFRYPNATYTRIEPKDTGITLKKQDFKYLAELLEELTGIMNHNNYPQTYEDIFVDDFRESYHDKIKNISNQMEISFEIDNCDNIYEWVANYEFEEFITNTENDIICDLLDKSKTFLLV